MESFQLPPASGSRHKHGFPSCAFLRLRPHYAMQQDSNAISPNVYFRMSQLYSIRPILIPIAHFRMIITEFTLKPFFVSFDALNGCPLSLNLPILILDISLPHLRAQMWLQTIAVFSKILFPSLIFFLATSLALTMACDIPILPPQHLFHIPSWQTQKFTCSAPPEVYIIKPSPNRGLGVFAARTLQPGHLSCMEPHW